MDLYPAIDLREGRSVRLVNGDFASETVYPEDPVAIARAYAEAGARRIHLVDLDAARTGTPANRDVIAAICAAVPCDVQVGGGVRTREAADALLALGAARVVVGTAAVTDPEWVEALCAHTPGAVAVGLDARGTEVAIHAWESDGGVDLLAMAAHWSDCGAGALIVTEIGRDGTFAGPDLDQLGAVLAVADIPVIASGGVGSVDDLVALSALTVADKGLAGAIVGRALAEGRVTLEAALTALT